MLFPHDEDADGGDGRGAPGRESMAATGRDTTRRDAGYTITEMLLVVIVVSLCLAIAVPMYLGQRDRARDSAVKSGVRQIQVGLLCYATDHEGAYPMAISAPDGSAPLVDDSGRPYLDDWPRNPWTGTPMQHSSQYSRGDFHYDAETQLASIGSGGGGAERFSLTGWTSRADVPFLAATPGTSSGATDPGPTAVPDSAP